MVTTTE